jgi:type I restriction enzyme M protein
MFELGNGEIASETELRRAITQMAADSGLGRLSAPVLKALVVGCFVRDPEGPILTDSRGDPIPDIERRDTENIPLDEDVEAYLDREVRPHVPGAWCPDPAGKIGYEIPFTRLFYKYTPPRPSAEIKAELQELEGEIHRLLAEVLG